MATEQDIKGWFLALQTAVERLAGAELGDAERQQVKLLAGLALRIGESIVLDLNRLANIAEESLRRGE